VLVLDGVYRTIEGVPVFHAVRAPTAGELQALLSRIIKRLMRLLTRQGYLIEEPGMTYLADQSPTHRAMTRSCRWSITPLRISTIWKPCSGH
jgi:hypothetical protein